MSNEAEPDNEEEPDNEATPLADWKTAPPGFRAYGGHGVEFLYPSDWEVHDDTNEDRVALTVESGETTFWTLALFADAPAPEEVLDCAAAAYQDDYPGADVYPRRYRDGPLGPMISCEVEFLCLELLAAARLAAYRAASRTVLVLDQGSDGELDIHRERLDRMTASIRVFEEHPLNWNLGDE